MGKIGKRQILANSISADARQLFFAVPPFVARCERWFGSGSIGRRRKAVTGACRESLYGGGARLNVGDEGRI